MQSRDTSGPDAVPSATGGAATLCLRKRPADDTGQHDSLAAAGTVPRVKPERPPVEDLPSPPLPSWPAIAGYEILDEIGQGNMGVVYRARQVALNRLVALKMIRAGAHARADERARFLDEARVVALLHHPNIVQIYDVGLQGDVPYFCMEYVDGGNLAERLGGRPQPARHAARMAEVLARAIHVAHQQGVIHRDLKPANILVRRPDAGTRTEVARRGLGDRADAAGESAALTDFGLKITDFGLAKQQEKASSQTESGVIMGTPNYMAPEQAEGRSRDVGPGADIYSLGAILYELLTGRPPYNAESPLETLLQMVHAEPLPPSRLQPKVPRDLETICLKCLQKEPRKRYASALKLADDCAAFLRGEPIAARRAPLAEQAWKWARRRPALAAVAGSAVAAVLGLAGLLIWHQADLRAELQRALEGEREARAASDAAARRESLAEVREQVLSLLGTGQAALDGGDWEKARPALVRARDLASPPELADLLARADELTARADRRQADRERFHKFRRRRNDALFSATLFTGGDLVAGLEETRRAAAEALALYGVAPVSEVPPAVDNASLQEGERAEVVAGCYELLVVLAEAVAQPLAGQSEADQRRAAGEALPILDRASRLGVTTRAYHLRRAHCLAQAGDPAGAQRERQRAEELRPAGALDFFLLGEEHYRRGEWPKAVAAFEGALQRQPDHFWAQYYLALCRLKTHRPELAVAGLTPCLAARPDFVWTYLLRGSAWAELGQFANAEADFDAAFKYPLDGAALFGLYVNRGVMRLRQERLDLAVADLEKAIALRPRQYQGYVNLAQAYLKEQKPDEAARQMDQAIQQEGGMAALYRTRARVHQLRQDDAAALADLERAIDLDARNPSSALPDDHLARARILLRRQDARAALSACDEALRLRPQDAAAHRLRAEVLLKMDRHAEALRDLDACVKYGPAEADLLCARGAVRARLGDYPGAQADYARALELRPDAQTRAARGWTYVVADAPRLALPDFEEAIRLDPQCGDGYAGRGLVRALLGQPMAAADDAEEALRRGPHSSRLVYNAARAYAQAAAHLVPGAGLDVTSLRLRFQERSLQLLRAAIELLPAAQRGAFWTASVQADAALLPLRETAEFGRLAGQYGR
jgi:serine/threonine protein kinase/tetratricopeptide (TPR) repeat protein